MSRQSVPGWHGQASSLGRGEPPSVSSDSPRPSEALDRATLAPITAVVVTRNEAHKLENCLASLHWCDELIVIDLQSTDDSRAIACRHTDRVLSHAPSPIVEPVRCVAAPFAQNDWLLFVDPDERFPAALVGDVCRAIQDHPRAGVIRLPWQFYFKGRRLDGSVWGGPNRSKRSLLHRRRVEMSPLSHVGSRLLDGFEEVRVARTQDNAVAHHWMDSYVDLIGKHWRYVCAEGEARFCQGQRFGPRKLLIEPLAAFKSSYRDFAGWRLGFRGLFLSVLYAAFHAGAAVSLALYQWRRSRAARPDSFHQPLTSLEQRRAA